MQFAQFKKIVSLSKEDIYLEALGDHRQSIRVKNEKRVVKNLERIFSAALSISNAKGFQAMSMRDLSRESGISMGALYAYFSSKEELLTMLQNQRRTLIGSILNHQIEAQKTPREQLWAAIKTHLFLSEIMQPWFYFSFMEAKNLSRKEKQKAIAADRYTDETIQGILDRGCEQGVFAKRDTVIAAGMIKAMLQSWYLKRTSFRSRRISVDSYADGVIECVEAYMLLDETRQMSADKKQVDGTQQV